MIGWNAMENVNPRSSPFLQPSQRRSIPVIVKPALKKLTTGLHVTDEKTLSGGVLIH
jgi:hypothetical protein